MKLVFVFDDDIGEDPIEDAMTFEYESAESFKLWVLEKIKHALHANFDDWNQGGWRSMFYPFNNAFPEMYHIIGHETLNVIRNDRRLIETLAVKDIRMNILSLDEWFDRNKYALAE